MRVSWINLEGCTSWEDYSVALKHPKIFKAFLRQLYRRNPDSYNSFARIEPTIEHFFKPPVSIKPIKQEDEDDDDDDDEFVRAEKDSPSSPDQPWTTPRRVFDYGCGKGESQEVNAREDWFNTSSSSEDSALNEQVISSSSSSGLFNSAKVEGGDEAAVDFQKAYLDSWLR